MRPTARRLEWGTGGCANHFLENRYSYPSLPFANAFVKPKKPPMYAFDGFFHLFKHFSPIATLSLFNYSCFLNYPCYFIHLLPFLYQFYVNNSLIICYT